MSKFYSHVYGPTGVSDLFTTAVAKVELVSVVDDRHSLIRWPHSAEIQVVLSSRLHDSEAEAWGEVSRIVAERRDTLVARFDAEIEKISERSLRTTPPVG